MKFNVFALSLLAVLSCSATTIPCVVTSDITTITGTTDCESGVVDYFNLSVGQYGFNSVTVSITGEEVNGQSDILHLTFDTDPTAISDPNLNAYIWIRGGAQVGVGGINIDQVYLENTSGYGETVYEQVCTVDYTLNYGSCPTGDILADVAAHPGDEATASFAPQQVVYWQKWDSFKDASVIEIDNGFGSDAPEPGTMVMIGLGLVGVALKAKRRTTKAQPPPSVLL